jgi:hypothetical protein
MAEETKKQPEKDVKHSGLKFNGLTAQAQSRRGE